MLFRPDIAREAFGRAHGRCEICGKVLDSCTDVSDAPEHGWTVTQYVPGPVYTLGNAYVVCLDCHIVWFMKYRIEKKLSRKDRPKVLTSEEFQDVRAFYYRRYKPIQYSAEGWIWHWNHMKEVNASPELLHLRPLALLPPVELEQRIAEEDALMHAAKKNKKDAEAEEDEDEEMNEEEEEEEESCQEQTTLQI